jgi:hypothetical protein
MSSGTVGDPGQVHVHRQHRHGDQSRQPDQSYNASIAAGSSMSVGFQGTWTNSDAVPTGFTVNGATCAT